VSQLSRRGLLATAAGTGLAAALPTLGRAEGGEVHEVTLIAAERPTRLLGDDRSPLPLWTYDPACMPTLRLLQGDRLRATLVNQLPEHTSIHWHGLRVPNGLDGVPFITQQPVQPGASYVYDFVLPDTGTYFFHPHCDTAQQLGRGLVGIIVVEGDTDRPFDADLVLAVRDFRIDEAGRFLPFVTDEGASRGGSFGTVRTVNGTAGPTLAIPAGGDVRLRILNIDNTRVMEIGLEGANAAIVAIDGNAVPPQPLRSWRMGPAMRLDVALRAPAPGSAVRLLDYFAPEPVELATLTAAGGAASRPAFAPWPLRPNALAEPDLGNTDRLRLTFSATAVAQDLVLPDGSVLRYADSVCLSDRTFWAINHLSWPESGHARLPPPLFEVQRGRTQILELVNATPQMHPIHLHGHFFKVLKARRDMPPHWADTVLLGPNDRIEVAFVADNPGDWMLHCHIIEHQETGMMAFYRVA
jgi:FtsP/CotA-like multicopper oxidase with cupredoxin domain